MTPTHRQLAIVLLAAVLVVVGACVYVVQPIIEGPATPKTTLTSQPVTVDYHVKKLP